MIDYGQRISKNEDKLNFWLLRGFFELVLFEIKTQTIF